MNRRKRHLGAALLIAVIVLSGCLEFESIEQPSSVRPGEMFTVSIEVAVDFNDAGHGREPSFEYTAIETNGCPQNDGAKANLVKRNQLHNPNFTYPDVPLLKTESF